MSPFAVTFMGLAAQGFAYAILGFPFAWFAMPKSMKSESFANSRWGYLASILVVPLLTGLEIFGLQDTSHGIEPSSIAPLLGVVVCALFVYLFRKKRF